MLKKEIWAIKRLGFPSLHVMISVRVQGLGFEHRAFALSMAPRRKRFNLSPSLYKLNKQRRKESSDTQQKQSFYCLDKRSILDKKREAFQI